MKNIKNNTSEEPSFASAGGCCVSKGKEKNQPKKYILVYPYTDPTTPFSDLSPEQITLYFHVTNKTGKPSTSSLLGGPKEPTCAANCSGCYFQTLPPYEVDTELAKQVARDFREQGYDMGLVTADSFSDIALDRLGQAGSAFRYDISEQNGNAWTSGNLLSGPTANNRLSKGWQIGYGIITISLYNTVLDHPMEGTPKKEPILRAIKNIKAWNTETFPEGGGYDIITTQLISKKSCNLASMRKVADWCLENNIRVCRFNAFANFINQDGVQEYELTTDDVKTFWKHLSKLQEEYLDTPLQFGVSEDMSAEGIEECISFFDPKDGWELFDSENPYWCRAGYRLFSINGVKNTVNDEIDLVITGCVDNWSKAPIGKVIYDTDQERYIPDFDVLQIESLRSAIRDKTISTCWGGVGNPNGKEETRGFLPSTQREQELFGGPRQLDV